MTTHELRKLREEMQQSPRSMADLLGINIHTYYLWERGKGIPQRSALAIQFLAVRGLPKDPAFRHRAANAYRTKFSKDARFGRLRVLGSAPRVGASRHSRVQVICDCGVEKVMRTTSLAGAAQCGRHCRLNGTPLPPTATALTQDIHPDEPDLDEPDLDEPDLDEPDLDEPDVVWRRYNDRKEREQTASTAITATTLPPLDEEWEEGL